MDETEPDVENELVRQEHAHDSPRELPPEFDETSPADRLIEQLKRSRIVPGQFRLSTLLWAFLVLAVLFATPRMIGMDFGRFFLLIYAVFYAFAPLTAWAGVNLCTVIPRERRIEVGATLMLSLALPMLAIAAWQGGVDDAVMTAFCSLCFWMVQLLGIAALYFLLFRDWGRRRAGRPKRPQ